MPKKKNRVTHSPLYNSFIEWIICIGFILFFIAFISTTVWINIKNPVVLQDNPQIEIELLIWDSFFNIGTGLLVILDLVTNFAAYFLNDMRKFRVKILTLSIVITLLSIFDNVAIKYPFHQLWIILVNLIAVFICIILDKNNIL